MVKNGREQNEPLNEVVGGNVLEETLPAITPTRLEHGEMKRGSRSLWDGSSGGIEETLLFSNHSILSSLPPQRHQEQCFVMPKPLHHYHWLDDQTMLKGVTPHWSGALG